MNTEYMILVTLIPCTLPAPLHSAANCDMEQITQRIGTKCFVRFCLTQFPH